MHRVYDQRYGWLYPLEPTTRIVDVRKRIASGGPIFSLDEAIEIGEAIGIDWDTAEFDPEDFQMGLDVELEHGSMLGPEYNVTDDDPLLTGMIAWAHLYESPDYYIMLDEMESQFAPDSEEIVAARVRLAAMELKQLLHAVGGTLGVAKNSIEAGIRALKVSVNSLGPEEKADALSVVYALQNEVEHIQSIIDEIKPAVALSEEE
jgi:hypothetical protein